MGKGGVYFFVQKRKKNDRNNIPVVPLFLFPFLGSQRENADKKKVKKFTF